MAFRRKSGLAASTSLGRFLAKNFVTDCRKLAWAPKSYILSAIKTILMPNFVCFSLFLPKSKIAEFSVQPKTAQSRPETKSYKFNLIFIALGIYNFDGNLDTSTPKTT